MKHLLRTMAFPLLAVNGLCGADAWWLFHKGEFTNAANFHVLRAPTNLPPEVVSAGSSEDSWTIEADGSGHLTPAKSWRLIWAATSDDYLVVHTEYVRAGHTATNYMIVVATVPKTSGTRPGVRRVHYHAVKDFRTFAHEMQIEVQAPVGVGF